MIGTTLSCTNPIAAASRRSSCLIAIVGILLASAPARGDFNFEDFSDVSALQLNGAAAQAGNALRLTPATFSQGGSAFTTTPVSLGDENTFSTYFQFQITESGGISDADGIGADGLVFVIQTVSNSVGGNGGGIGYLGISPSLGVEFDSWFNGGDGEPDGNHVGIDFNGSVASVVTASEPTRFNDGQVWNAWIEYDGTTDTLEARWSTSEVRPTVAQLATTVDLPTLIGQDTAFVGFTSGTGAAYGNHDILSWIYRESGNPIPEPSSLVLLGIVGAVLSITPRGARRRPR